MLLWKTKEKLSLNYSCYPFLSRVLTAETVSDNILVKFVLV